MCNSQYKRLNQRQDCYLIEILAEDKQPPINYFKDIRENYVGVKRWVPCERVLMNKNVNKDFLKI